VVYNRRCNYAGNLAGRTDSKDYVRLRLQAMLMKTISLAQGWAAIICVILYVEREVENETNFD